MSRYVQPGNYAPIPVKIFGLESAESETVTAQLIEKVKDNEIVLTSVNENSTAGITLGNSILQYAALFTYIS